MFKKWILFLVVFAIVLIITANVLLYRGLYSEKLKEVVVSSLETATKRPVRVDQVRLQLFPFYLLMEGLTVGQPSGAAPPALTVTQAKVSFSPWSLLTEVFLINKISLTEPAVHVIEPSNFSGSPVNQLLSTDSPSAGSSSAIPESPKRKKPRLALRAVEILKGRLSVKRPNGEPHLELSGLSSLIEPDLLMQNFRVNLTTETVKVSDPKWSGSMDRVEATFLVHPGEIEVKRLSVTSQLFSATARGLVKTARPVSVAINIETDASIALIGQFLDLKRNWTGEARFAGEITGSYPELVVKGPVSLHRIVLDGQSIGDASASFSYQDKVLTLGDLAGRLLDGKARGNATVKLGEQHPVFSMTLELEKLHAEPVSTLLFPRIPLNGKVLSGKVSLAGSGASISSLNGGGSLTIMQAGPSDVHPSDSKISGSLFTIIRDADIRFHTAQGVWQIEQADFKTPQSSLALRGTIHPDQSIRFTADLNTQRLNEIASASGLPQLDGQGTATAALTGTFSDPSIRGEIALNNVKVHDRPLGSLSSRFQYGRSLLALSRTEVRHGESRITGQGKLDFNTGPVRPTFELLVRFAHVNPQDLLAVFKKEFSMTTGFSGDVKLKRDSQTFSGEGAVRLEPGTILNQPVHGGEFIMKLSDDRFRITRASLKTKNSSLEGNGSFSMDGSFSARLRSGDFNLEDFEWLREKLPALQGHGPITVHGSGNLKDPEVSAQVTIKDMNYSDLELGEGRIRLQVADHQAQVMISSEAGLSLQGVLQVVSPFKFNAELAVKNMRLDPWVALWYPSAVSRIRIQSSGLFAVNGDLEHLKDLEVQARLPDLSLDFAGYKVNNDEEIAAVYEKEQLAIRSFKLKGEGTFLTILGNVRFERDIDLQINGEADLGLLQLITPEIPYGQGKTYLAMQLYDQWKDPKLRGGLILRNGTIRTGSIFQTVSVRSLGISFDERRVLLESLDGEIGNGHLEGSGKAELKNLRLQSFGLLFEVTDLTIPSFYGFDTTMDGTLVFQGTPQANDIRGEINIKRALYGKRSNLKTVAVSSSPPPSSTKTESKKSGEGSSILKGTSLNIHLSGKDRLWINNNLAKLPLEVDLALRGTLTHPILLGRIEAREGVAFLRDNEFQITTAVVDFIDPEQPKPVFEIEAKTVIRKNRITLRLSGRPDKFRVNLTADSPLNETDIFALLLIGKTATEVTQPSSGLGVAETSLLIPENVQRRLLATTGRFFMPPSYAARGSKTPRFAIVKRVINEKFFLIYAVNLETSEEHLIRIEQLIGSNRVLIGERDPENGMSHEIVVRMESRT